MSFIDQKILTVCLWFVLLESNLRSLFLIPGYKDNPLTTCPLHLNFQNAILYIFDTHLLQFHFNLSKANILNIVSVGLQCSLTSSAC